MMEITIKTISLYVETLGGKSQQKVELKENSSIQDLFTVLISTYGNVIKETFFDDYELKQTKRGTPMFLNGTNIFALDGLDTKLKPEDEFLILPPIAGG